MLQVFGAFLVGLGVGMLIQNVRHRIDDKFKADLWRVWRDTKNLFRDP